MVEKILQRFMSTGNDTLLNLLNGHLRKQKHKVKKLKTKSFLVPHVKLTFLRLLYFI